MSNPQDEEEVEYLFKLLIIGDSAVGKTCLLLRYTDNTFTTNHILTVGIDYKMKRLTVGDKSVSLQIWDTAGQERFRTITKTYYTNSHGIMLTYSVTDQKSFLNIQNWIKQIQANAQTNICKILVGNKCDCKPEERKVSYQEGKKLAEEFGLEFFEVSAKNDINVEQSFLKLTEITMDQWGEKVKKMLKRRTSNVLKKPEPKKDKCCGK